MGGYGESDGRRGRRGGGGGANRVPKVRRTQMC